MTSATWLSSSICPTISPPFAAWTFITSNSSGVRRLALVRMESGTPILPTSCIQADSSSTYFSSPLRRMASATTMDSRVTRMEWRAVYGSLASTADARALMASNRTWASRSFRRATSSRRRVRFRSMTIGSSRMFTGFVTKSLAPRWSEALASSTSLCPVRSTMGTSGWMRAVVSASSMPERPGMA